MQNFFHSKTFKIIAGILVMLTVSAISFAIGIAIGFHKAKFSYHWGENYERNFVKQPPMKHGGRSGRFEKDFMPGMEEFRGRNFRNPHGISGLVILKSENMLIIKDEDDKENTITLSEKTLIKKGSNTITINDIQENDHLVVLGGPNEDGTVLASLIRVF